MRAVERVSYDREADVLYISTRLGRKAVVRESLPGVLWRYDAESGELVGVTVMDFLYYWAPRMADLSKDLSAHLRLSQARAMSILQEVQ